MTTPSRVLIGVTAIPALNVEGRTIVHLEPVLQALRIPWTWLPGAGEVAVQTTWQPPAETWQELAGRMGRLAGLTEQEEILLLATVTAESEGDNALVEYANPGKSVVGGAGYGQVWPRWHRERILASMKALDRPSLPKPLWTSAAALNAVLLLDAEVSMLTVATLVRDLWRAAAGDWDRFTESYVGSGIPADDRERRRVIWERWQAG